MVLNKVKCISKEALYELEHQIDVISGQESRSEDIDIHLKKLLMKYSYEVSYYNAFRNRYDNVYKDKYLSKDKNIDSLYSEVPLLIKSFINSGLLKNKTSHDVKDEENSTLVEDCRPNN